MKLIDIIKGIFDDYDNSYAYSKSNLDESTELNYRRRGDPNSSYAFLKLYIPNFVGFFLGLALSRVMGLDLMGYLIFGIICAIVIGMTDNIVMRKMEFVTALVRNAILTLFLAIVVGISFSLLAAD